MVTVNKDDGESQNSGVVDTAVIAAAVKKNDNYLVLLKKLAERQRGKAYLTVERMKRDTGVTAEECLEFFDVLETSGAGDFEAEENWNHSTFYWHTRIAETATAILRELKSGKHHPVSLSNLPPAATSARPPKAAPEFAKAATAKSAEPKRGPGRPAKTASPLPRILAPTAPVMEALEATAPSPVAAQPGSSRGSILVQIRGMEFELDLTKVPAELLKFRRML